MSFVSTIVLVNGKKMPCEGWAISDGAHGATGGAELITSWTGMQDAGFDLFAETQHAPSSTPIKIMVDPADGSGSQPIFSGEYMTDMWDMATDTVHVQARNAAGRLVDQKQVLTSSIGTSGGTDVAPGENAKGTGFQTQNQTLSGFVSTIAKQMGLTPKINLASNPQIGALFGDTLNTVVTTNPSTLWAILIRLANDTGNIVYASPTDELYFGQEGQNGSTLNFTWNKPAQSGARPVQGLTFVRNPRKNSSFKIRVHSYDHTKGQVTTGASQMDGISKPSGGVSPIYTFHKDGMTQAQVDAKASAIAKDIGKREVIAQFITDIIPSIRPGQPATLSGDIPSKFAGLKWYVHHFRHSFRMPEGDSFHDRAQLETAVSLLLHKNPTSS